MFGSKTPAHEKTRLVAFEDLPTNFDARVQWPDWFTPVVSQGQWNGGWAFGLS